jgi:hypothetical protein
MTRSALVVGLFLPTGALAHHGTGTTQVTAPVLAVPTATEGIDEGVAAQVGLRYDLARLDQRVQEDQRQVAEAPVSMHRATLSGGLRLPRQRSMGLSVPVGLVHGVDGDSYGAGDVSLWLGQGVGRTLRLQVEGGLTAPTGAYQREAAHTELDVQGLEDGQFLMATYATRTSLGAGSWSAQGRAAARAPLGPAAVRGYGALSQPIDQTPDGFRWGRDVVAGGAVASPAMGPLTVELGADRRWHQTDRFAFVDEETGEPMERPVGQRSSTGLTAAVSLKLSERASCRFDGYRLVGQKAAGIQLMASAGAGGGCQLVVPAPKRRVEAQVAESEAEPEVEQASATRSGEGSAELTRVVGPAQP